MNGKFFVGGNAISFSRCETPLPVSKVVLWVDDENCYEAGTDDGTVLEVDCPYATQDMANALLSSMKGYQYHPGEIEGSNLSPLAELGDGVTVGGEYIPLIRQYITLGNTPVSDFSAPLTKEIDHEYQYASPIQQQIKRNTARTRSLITKTSKEIMLKVEDINGKYTEVKTTVDGFTVTGPDGTTLIDGGKLKANSVTANQIDATNLKVAAANITGTLTANQIQTGSIRVGDLKDGSNYATKSYVDSNAGLSASEVDQAIKTYIDETSITAEKLRGRYVQLLASSDRQVGQLGIEYTTTGYGVSIKTDYGGIQLIAGGNVYLAANGDNGGFVTVSDNYVSLGGGKLIIGSKMYGPSLPSNPQYGQLFFLKK